MRNKDLHCCRVCGFYYRDFYPWGETGQDPSREICDCCGIEFGYEDSTPEAARKSRQKWIEGGMKWFEPKYQPQSWNFEDQFKNIPSQFK